MFILGTIWVFTVLMVGIHLWDWSLLRILEIFIFKRDFSQGWETFYIPWSQITFCLFSGGIHLLSIVSIRLWPFIPAYSQPNFLACVFKYLSWINNSYFHFLLWIYFSIHMKPGTEIASSFSLNKLSTSTDVDCCFNFDYCGFMSFEID